jgi:hypothetical protein
MHRRRPPKENTLKKLLLASALFLAASQAADAGPREDSLAGIARCSQQSDDRAWLDCVYGAVQPVRGKLGLPPAPAFQQKLATGVAAAPPPAIAAAPVRPSNSRWVPLRTYSFDRHGMFTVTLADGTIWQQNADDVNFAHWKGPAAQYFVSAGGGLFGGSGTLDVRNDGSEYNVHRVR